MSYISLFINPCFSGYASNRQAVIELIPQIELNCPPLASTTSIRPPTTTLTTSTTSIYPPSIPVDFCELSCIEDLNEQNLKQGQEIAELRQENSQQGQEILELTQLVHDLTEVIKNNDDRMVELEKIVREINSRP